LAEKKSYIDFGDEFNQKASQGGEQPRSQIIKIEDANTETARVLVPQMGTDNSMLSDGMVDVRRFTHISPLDPVWMSFFNRIPKEAGGNYARAFIADYCNYSYSVEGRHKKLVVSMQSAVGGNPQQDKPKKKQGIIDRILGRKEETED